MGKKLLIASGTGNYDNLPQFQLPGIKKTVDSVAALFTGRLGYSRVLEEISNDPTSDQLHETLDEWLGSVERDQSDWVVFYYTGHGELVGSDKLYLLTRNYRIGLTHTAFNVEEFASMLCGKDASGENRKVKRCLIILDTCHSGAGALGISHQIGKPLSMGGHGAMFYLLAASYPRQEALAGAMAEALIQSVEDPSIGGTLQPLLYFDQLIPAINRRLKISDLVYAPVVVSPDEEPQFFPNPRYIPELPSGATVADIRRAVETGELRSFWDPISRGVEVESQPGWYFTGRERVLRELSFWLRDPTDMRARVITGQPGSGKSAILARIVTLSDRENCQLMPRQEEHMLEAFPTGIIDLAIHAKGKTFQEIADRLASHLKTGASEILTTLASRVQPFHVVIDALDEATDPARIARDLLAPMLRLSNVKLLVGTRPEYASKLDTGAVQLQIDQSEYLDEAELAEYVTARLLGQALKGEKTPYEDAPEFARDVAEAVAKRAYPNFLIARLVAEDLVARPQPITRDEIAQSDFPTSVGAAFEQYMTRFGTEQERVRDLLVPLAWAEGLGLPWANVWPAVASGLSGHSYEDEDIRWVLDRAGSFVVEALERDRSVYRLYHQALADHLRRRREVVPTQRRITETLIQTVPGLADGDSKDWRTAQPYILAHLAEHAAAGGLLPEVVKDPLFVLTADPDRLVAIMGAHAEGVPAPIMRAYQVSVHLMKTNPLPERASYLEMGARKATATDFADRLSRLPLQRPWDVPWVRWSSVSTHRILGKNKASIRLMAVTERQGRAVIVSNGDETMWLRIWDLERGEEACAPLIGHTEAITALAVTERRGQTMVISGSSDGSIRIWDLDRGEEVCAPLTGNLRPVIALAVTKWRGQTVVASGSDDNVLRIWDLESGKEARSPTILGGYPPGQIGVAERLGRTVAINTTGLDQRIQVWDLESGKESCPPIAHHTFSRFVVTRWQGRAVVFFGSDHETIRVWDLERDKEAWPRITGHPDSRHVLAVANWQGRAVVFFGSSDGSIRIWDLERGEEACAPLTGNSGDITALAVTEWRGRTVAISGSSDGSIRVWHLERGEEASAPRTGDLGDTTALAVTERRGLTVVVFGSRDGSIRIWDLERGEEACAPLIGHTEAIRALAVTERRGQTMVISGSSDGSIRIWDLDRGEEVCAPLTGHTGAFTALAVTERRGQSMVISGSDDDVPRIWDLESGKEAYPPRTRRMDLKTMAGRWVAALFARNTHRRTVIAYNSDGTLRIFEEESGKEACAHRFGSFSHPVVVAEWRGRTVVAEGSGGTMRVFDLKSGKEARAPLDVPGCTKLAVTEWGGRTVVISGAHNQTVCVWDFESDEPLRTIEVGAPVVSLVLVAGPKIVVGTRKGFICLRLL